MRLGLISCVCSMVGFVLGLILLGAGFILYSQFESIFGNTVRNQMYIDDNVYWWFDVWLKPPGKETLTIHIFEVENAAEWRKNPARTRPNLRVIGPFVFRVQRAKENVNFTAEDHQQITYDERTVYQFDELLSYESLDEKVTVANAELMVGYFFGTESIHLGDHPAGVISEKHLQRSKLDYKQDFAPLRGEPFIERPVHRIVFGPSGSPDEGSNSPLPTMPEIPADPGYSGDFPGGSSNESFTLAKLQQANSAQVVGPGNVPGVKDEATLEILKLYDKGAQFFERLGVDINPYDLLASQLGKEVVKTGKSARLQDSAQEQPYRFNSMLAFFQNNSLQKFDLFTGKESSQNGKIIRWNNQNKMDKWFSRSCNEINGTDGRQYGPFVRARRLYEFNPKVCRSVPMQLRDQGVTKEQGINYFRYTRASDFMQSPVKYTANGCYCRWWAGGKGKALVNNNKRCNYDGILDLGTCYSGTNAALNEEPTSNTSTPHSSPVILSNPHFSGPITKSITREIGGLSPDEKIYASHVDVEPVSGIVLQRANKFQFNLHVRPLPLQLRSNQTLRELIVPLLWFEELWQLSPEHQNHIKYFFVYPLKYQELAIFGLIGAGLCAVLFGVLCLCCCCCMQSKKNEQVTDKKSSGKVSPSQPPVEEMQPNDEVPLQEPYDDDLDENGIPIATYGNQWGTNQMDGRNYPLPPPTGENYIEDMMMPNDGSNQHYFENANYVDDQMIQQPQQGQTMPPNGYPPQAMNGRMTQTMGRISQNEYQNGYPNGGQPQYPLERLKRNMPAKQSASTYSMRTLQPRGPGQMQGQQMQGQQMQGQQMPGQQMQMQRQQMQPGQRPGWNDQPPENYDEMTAIDDDYDYYYSGNKAQGYGNEEDYYAYRNDSGNDSMQSNNQNQTGGPQSRGAVGYYETYDEYGHPRPPPSEPGIEIYQNNPYGMPPPPPPANQGGRNGGGGSRENLMAEIRNGTKLRKTSPTKETHGIPIEDLIAATSTAVVQQVLQQLERRQQILRPPVNPQPQESRSLDLELLAKIITNSQAVQNPVNQRPTNNFIINIHGGPQGQMNNQNAWNDPQMMSYIQSLMYPGYQQQQQPAITYQQQLALMSLMQPGSPGMMSPMGQMTAMNSMYSMGYPSYPQASYPALPPAPIQSQPQAMPAIYPNNYTQPGFYSSETMMQQEPKNQMAQVAIQETQMLMQQPQQQQFVFQRIEARSSVEQESQERESQNTYVKSPSPEEPLYMKSPASSVSATEMQLPNHLPLPEAMDTASGDFSQQQQGAESIRFYGPYRAYHPPNTTRVRSRNRTATRRPETGEWDTSFDEDEDDDEQQSMQITKTDTGKQQKKYV